MAAEVRRGGAAPVPRTELDGATAPGTLPATATRSSAESRAAPADGMESARPAAPGAPASPSTAGAISRSGGAPTAGGPDLTAGQRARVDALMARLSPGDRAALRSLLQSPAWADPAARDDILTLVENLPGGGHVAGSTRRSGSGSSGSPLEVLVTLASPRPGETRPALLDRAADGATLAHHLAQAAQTPPDSEVLTAIAPQSRGQVTAELVREIADPGRINQGPNTCGATAMQYAIITQNPAEYARLTAGLLHPGHVEMRDGNTLRRDGNSIAPSALSQRSPTERLFQGALMEYASEGDYQTRQQVGDDGTIDEGDRQAGGFMARLPRGLRILLDILIIGLIGELIAAILMATGNDNTSGLLSWEYDKAASSLFGREHQSRLSYLGFTNTAASQVEAFRAMTPDGNFHNLGVAVSFDWLGGHFLNVERLDETTVPPSLILRNPHGSYHDMNAGDPAPSLPDGVTIENPNLGMVRVPLTDALVSDITGVYFPSSMDPHVPSGYEAAAPI